MSNCIPISIGVLTCNRAKTLERCLQSLERVCEIVIADGGSTDSTFEIAKKYNCTVIKQTSAGPITDFSKERNNLLDHASYDWFFYLDDDEIATPELLESFAKICNQENPEHLVYNVPYYLISEDLSIRYKQFKAYYQQRLFNKKSGARFYKKMHEKIVFDASSVSIATIDAPWLVPLDTQLDFSVYKAKMQYRVGVMVESMGVISLRQCLRVGLKRPFITIAKHVYKLLYLRATTRDWNQLIPLRYELYRIYMQLYLLWQVLRKYVAGHTGRR